MLKKILFCNNNNIINFKARSKFFKIDHLFVIYNLVNTNVVYFLYRLNTPLNTLSNVGML
jgi:hypothetical protein